MSSLQKLTAKNAKDAKAFISKYYSAYSAVSAVKRPFCSEVIYPKSFVPFV